jgi:hypothetical protein
MLPIWERMKTAEMPSWGTRRIFQQKASTFAPNEKLAVAVDSVTFDLANPVVEYPGEEIATPKWRQM